MKIDEKIKQLPDGKYLFHEKEDHMMSVQATGITTTELKQLVADAERWREALELAMRVIEDLLSQQAMPDNSYDAEIWKINKALAASKQEPTT